jgi:hypothetical protein
MRTLASDSRLLFYVILVLSVGGFPITVTIFDIICQGLISDPVFSKFRYVRSADRF